MSAYVWVTLLIVLMDCFFSAQAQGSLQTDFYSLSCPKGEAIVRSTVEKYFKKDSSMAAGLLRLHFHDCFVQGCDGSILISGASAERTALPNIGLRGFEVVDDAKSQLEAACPGVVSCADILALAARDSVDLTGGPSWSVPLGRRDGRVSSASDATSLPAPTDTVSVQLRKFLDKGLNEHDLVTLVGAHTIGQTDCLFFRYRLYNFTATGNADPTISQSFLPQLRSLCPQNGDASRRVALDAGSMTDFDVSYFKNVRDGQGVLESDQRLWEDATTQNIVRNYAGNVRGLLGLRFSYDFPKAMVKMSSIGVNTGKQGEVRKICSKFN
ncbi:peroxidase 25-like isoform X1 [Asparagus officinalis]|uniref:peroxidase 25-like isoform X1 n=2 Tax=Asparagus officinalis TaxID=4686 RepID=UPI00098E0481|nr:peroxidase 25-like isoform X1 [Asparagus officinalis]